MLLGLDFEIQYKKGRSNVATDALSKVHESSLNSLTTVLTTTDFSDELQASWALPGGYKSILDKLKVGTSCKHFTLVDRVLRKKERVVVGPQLELKV